MYIYNTYMEYIIHIYTPIYGIGRREGSEDPTAVKGRRESVRVLVMHSWE